MHHPTLLAPPPALARLHPPLCTPALQALVRALELEPCALAGAGGLFGFVPLTMLALVAGSCCIHMCASTITAFGLGNGSSLVICAGIITGGAGSGGGWWDWEVGRWGGAVG